MKENESYESASRYCACIQFLPAEDVGYGFSVGQLIAFNWGHNPDAESNKDAPDRLAIAFSTADVVILGRHLDRLANLLGENSLAKVRTLPGGSEKVERHSVFVASIKITPIEKE